MTDDIPFVPVEKMKGYEDEREIEEEIEKEEERKREKEERDRRREEREEKEREKEERKEKKEEYEEIATAGLSIGAIIGIGILGIIALSLTGSGQYQYPQGESVNEWKPLTEDEIQNIMIINDKY